DEATRRERRRGRPHRRGAARRREV
ncbi:MAG: hypothetical protein AVDCRST_MAG85-696, partial [uncultured Solirubrobacteraceae bacterium]